MEAIVTGPTTDRFNYSTRVMAEPGEKRRDTLARNSRRHDLIASFKTASNTAV
jgi:hypothetical protein